MDKLKGWLLAYLVDGKRVTIAMIALLNLLTPKLAAAGVPVPEDATTQAIASYLAIAVLAVWSKLTAVKATVAAPPPTP